MACRSRCVNIHSQPKRSSHVMTSCTDSSLVPRLKIWDLTYDQVTLYICLQCKKIGEYRCANEVVEHLCFAAFSGETLAVFNICSMEKQTVLISLNTAVVFYGIHGMGGYTITYCSTFVYLFTTSDCVCLLFLNSFIMVGKKWVDNDNEKIVILYTLTPVISKL